jgi:TPR repeat protein
VDAYNDQKNAARLDFAAAEAACAKVADPGNKEAQYTLGRIYADRASKSFSCSKARLYLGVAAMQEHWKAMAKLAAIELESTCENRDRKWAEVLLRRASEAGEGEATYAIATMHHAAAEAASGAAAAKEIQLAVQAYLKAAESQSYARGYTALGQLHAAGTIGGKPDATKAKSYFLKARSAKEPDPGGGYELGRMFERQNDLVRARQCYEWAARLGYPYGMAAAGRLHRDGKGGLDDPDLVGAMTWFMLAARRLPAGTEAAKDVETWRIEIEKKMTPAQVKQATDNTANWKKSAGGACAN